MLFAGTAIAAADGPLDCTAADLARAASGVSNATADYLFTHPDVNGFFTGLKGLDEQAVRASTEDYLNANPQVRTDLQNIRQPLVDFRTRCQ
nr:heme-binding protein [Mycolicibacterium xanthum]